MPNEMIRQCLLLCTLECSADQLKLNIAAESPKRALGQLHSLMLMIGFSPPLASEICQKPRGSMPPGAKGGQKRGTSAVQPRTKPLAGSTKRVRRNRGKDNTEDDTPKGIKNVGHSFDRVIIEGHARAQLGNTYGPNVYYNAAHPSDESAEEKRWAALKKALGFRRMGFRLDTVNPAHADSCHWVLDTGEFKRWRDPKLRDSHHGFFWIKGKPGAGKSTIMKYLYEHVQDQKLDFVVLAFFFNARGELLEKSVEGMWRSLLHQLLSMVPECRKIIETSDSNEIEKTWEVATLRESFRKALLCLRDRKVICFIDALDECCDQNDARDMVAFLENVTQSTHQNKVSFYTCFASRHYPNIAVAHSEEIIMEKEKSHEADIKKYIFDKLILASWDLRNQLGIEIARRSRGVFFWVVLVVKELVGAFNRGMTRNELFDLLTSLPSDLDDMIRCIIQAGASDPCLLLTLQWVLVGLREHLDFFLVSLYFGVRFASGQTDMLAWDPNEIDKEGIAKFINHASKGLVEVTRVLHEVTFALGKSEWHYDVHFIHESVRGHILTGGLAILDTSLGVDVEAISHAKIANLCQALFRPQVLQRECSFTGPYEIQPGWTHSPCKPERLVVQCSDGRKLLSSPLKDYAYLHVFTHMEAAHVRGISQMSYLIYFPLQEWLVYQSQASGWTFKPSRTLLECLITEQYRQLSHDLLDYYSSHPDTESAIPDTDGTNRNPFSAEELGALLNAAVFNSRVDMINKLLDLGANIDAVNHHDLAQRLFIDPEGYSVLQSLLNRGVALSSTESNYSPLLALLACNPTELRRLMRWVRNAGPNVNIKPSKGYGSILEAATSSRACVYRKPKTMETVNWLLRRGANATGHENHVLPTASKAFDLDLARCLLQEAADGNAKNANGKSALQILASRIVLDENGVDFLGLRSKYGLPRTKFLDAWQTTITTQLLASHGANKECGSQRSPFITAVLQNDLPVAHTLLDLGADMLRRSEVHGTPLGIAFDNPERGMFWLLWDFGIATSVGLPNMNELQRKELMNVMGGSGPREEKIELVKGILPALVPYL